MMDSAMEWEDEGGNAGDMDTESCASGWRVYVKGKNTEPLDSWLQSNLPSQVSKEDGAEWIAVYRDFKVDDEADVEGLMDSWAQLQASGRPVNFTSIREIACNHKVLTGKWCVFTSSGGKIDAFWTLIAKHVLTDPTFPCRTAKVSTTEEKSPKHVICMYTDNFCDEDSMLRAEEAIRRIGIKSELIYKPDVYTYLNIYSSNVMTNPWGLRPVIMRSEFDILRGKSVITGRAS